MNSRHTGREGALGDLLLLLAAECQIFFSCCESSHVFPSASILSFQGPWAFFRGGGAGGHQDIHREVHAAGIEEEEKLNDWRAKIDNETSEKKNLVT